MSALVSGYVTTRSIQLAAGAALVLAALLIVPGAASPVWLGIVVQGLLLSLAVLGLTVLAGYGGQFSIASAGFMAIGAGVFVHLTTQMDVPLPLGLLGAVVAGALSGLVVGLPALRLRGVYLLLSTLAAHFIVIYFFAKYAGEVFGVYGVTFEPLEVAGVAFDTDEKWFYLLVGVVVLVSLFVGQLRRTGVGRSLLAIKQNEVAAAASGIDVVRLKLSAFVVSSALIAFTGALYGLYYRALASDFFTLQMAINLYVALVVGGQLAAMGAVIGGMFVAAGPTLVADLANAVENDWLLLHAPELTDLFFGIAILVILLVQPKGVWGLGTSLVQSLAGRLRPGGAAPSPRSAATEPDEVTV